MKEWEEHMTDFVPDDMLTFKVKEKQNEVIIFFFI